MFYATHLMKKYLILWKWRMIPTTSSLLVPLFFNSDIWGYCQIEFLKTFNFVEMEVKVFLRT